MKKMNVVFFDSRGISNLYGIGSYGEYLLPELAKNPAIDLTYVRVQYGNVGGIHIEGNRYKKITVTIAYGNVDNGFQQDRLPSSAAIILFHIMRMRLCINTGLIHINAIADFDLCHLAKKYGFKIVFTQHIALKNVYGQVVEPFFTKTKQLFSSCDGIIFLSEMTRQIAIQEYYADHTKTALIYNGTPTVKKWTKKAIFNERIKKGFSPTDFIVLFVGRIEESKGVYHLIDSFLKFSKGRNDVKLVIVGSGNYDLALRKAKHKLGKIHFTGFLNKKEVKNYYQLADIGVLPSYSEQSSFAVIEMLQHQLPLIVSDIDGFSTFSNPAEVLKAIIVKKPKLNSVHIRNLEKNIEALYLRPQQRAAMLSKCSTLRNSVFNSINMAKQTILFYKKIYQS